MQPRILIAGFKHETHTFSTMVTGLDAYRARLLLHGEELQTMRGTATEIAGFFDACEAQGWTPVPAVYADATPAGKVSREAFDHVLEQILQTAEREAPLHGMLLCLHGAMVCEHEDDGEAALLRAIRQRLGRDLPIAATHDLHANVSDETAGWLDILVSFRTYPHVDQYEVAREAADLLARTLAGAIRPRLRVARPALLDGVDHGRTTAPGPMTEILARGAALLAEDARVLSVSINAGFAYADVADAGPSVVLVTDGEHPRVDDLLDEFVAEMWQTRERRTVQTLSVAQVIERLRAGIDGSGPVVLADFSDNPGGGGYGDSTALLGALLDAGITGVALATLYDPEVTRAAHAAGVGARMRIALGGKMDRSLCQPLEVEAYVRVLTDGRFAFSGPMLRGQQVDMGPTAVLEVGGAEIVVTGRRFQAYDRMFFEHAGIDPTRRAVLVVKSAQHFRAAFAPLARAVLVVDSGAGLTTGNLAVFPYRKVRRPVFPLDADAAGGRPRA